MCSSLILTDKFLRLKCSSNFAILPIASSTNNLFKNSGFLQTTSMDFARGAGGATLPWIFTHFFLNLPNFKNFSILVVNAGFILIGPLKIFLSTPLTTRMKKSCLRHCMRLCKHSYACQQLDYGMESNRRTLPTRSPHRLPASTLVRTTNVFMELTT